MLRHGVGTVVPSGGKDPPRMVSGIELKIAKVEQRWPSVNRAVRSVTKQLLRFDQHAWICHVARTTKAGGS